ncbi:MAG: hypothetical protein D6721_00535 [Gammaproteobacteria bacterium]|nr:MAG: hypothetical protein D6721_00535 [Gammaproteobacteria bacterium]
MPPLPCAHLVPGTGRPWWRVAYANSVAFMEALRSATGGTQGVSIRSILDGMSTRYRKGRGLGILLVLGVAGLAVGILHDRGPAGPPPSGTRQAMPLPGARPGEVPPRPLPAPGERVVYDISLHDPDRLLALLNRLDAVHGVPRPPGAAPTIALVLHGPELLHFDRHRYAENRRLVDLAARLDAFGVIEVKACLTRMKALGLERSDLPAFVEFVPYGPDEVERLHAQGYRIM